MSTIEIGYNITTDPNFLDKQNAITPELSRKIEHFHKLALAGKRSSVQKLMNAIEQYPKNPQLKNYLSVLYGKLGENQKAFETNQWIIKEHPDYLFAKLNLANEYFLNEEYEKMPDILGEAMELKALYPERDTFHLSEVISFFRCTILYFTAIDDIKQAEMRYDMMTELAPDAGDTKFAFQHILLARMRTVNEMFEEDEKNRISVDTKTQERTIISIAPKFNHPETELLYNNGLYIGKEILNKIVALPRKTLIQDLEMVLQDSIDRYGYFSDLVEEEGWDEEKMNFVVHAIFLLGEIEASESIGSILKVLSQSHEYFELYLGDFLTSGLWEPVYKISKNELEACKQFVFKAGVDTYARSLFFDVVEQKALRHPEKQEEALLWFKDIIEFFLKSKVDDNVIDSEVTAFLICSVIDINGAELIPEIEKLFEKGIVSKGVCGDWQEVKQAFNELNTFDKTKEILPIVERYERIISTWAGYQENSTDEIHDDGTDNDYDDYYESKPVPVKAEPKVGRNDPCPCGSGKKYKKCCLNN